MKTSGGQRVYGVRAATCARLVCARDRATRASKRRTGRRYLSTAPRPHTGVERRSRPGCRAMSGTETVSGHAWHARSELRWPCRPSCHAASGSQIIVYHPGCSAVPGTETACRAGYGAERPGQR
eukprot:3136341-Rhodomonas_salina.1